MECRICGNSKNNEVYYVKERMLGLGDQFTYLQCCKCHCLQINEIPPPEVMKKYYPMQYYSFSKPSFPKGIKGALQTFILNRRLKYVLFGKDPLGKLFFKLFPGDRAVIFRYIKKGFDSTVLDVGSGSGHLICTLKKAGFKNCLGIDPYIPNEIRYNGSTRIEKKQLSELNTHFDIIIFLHSFEHMPEPITSLLHASRLLAARGVIIIATPYAESLAWKTYGEFWVQLDAPRHFHIHSKESMQILAEKTGLTIERCYWNSTDFQFAASELFKIDKTFSSLEEVRSFFPAKKIREFRKKANRLNLEGTGDSIIFHLKKIRL